MAEYSGSIELISGVKSKNNQDFPLMDAHSVQVDDTGMRLDEKLQELEAAIGSGGGGVLTTETLSVTDSAAIAKLSDATTSTYTFVKDSDGLITEITRKDG